MTTEEEKLKQALEECQQRLRKKDDDIAINSGQAAANANLNWCNYLKNKRAELQQRLATDLVGTVELNAQITILTIILRERRCA